MSEDERMDRAHRIRRLREGRRRDEADDDAPEAPDDADGPASDDATTGNEDDAEPTTGDGDDPEDATAELDEAIVETVERVSAASASVTDPREMGDAGDASGETGTDGAESAASDGTPVNHAGPTGDRAPVDLDAPDDGDGESPAERTAQRAARSGPGAESGVGHRATADTRVLEFTLGDEQFCIDIEYVEEIVKDEPITRVPNTPAFVEGVVDLRGQITTILDPKLLLSTEESAPGELLVVFDSEAFDDQGHLGWIVDDVRQVAPVADDEVDEPPVAEDYVNGVIDRGEDEPFVVWTSPEDAIESVI